jgi:anti-sigma factor RsiW
MDENRSTRPPAHLSLQLLPWYLSGTLNDTERRQVTAHLARCHVCRAELEALTLVRRMVREAFAESAPGPMRRLLSRIFKPNRRDRRLTEGIDNNG